MNTHLTTQNTRPRRVWRLTAISLAGVALLAACGGDDDSASDTTAAPAGTAAAAAPATSAAAAAPAADDDYGYAAPAAAEPAATPAAGASTVATAETSLGTVLVDANGRTLYAFTPDTDGEPTCVDSCADAWPPALVDGEPRSAISTQHCSPPSSTPWAPSSRPATGRCTPSPATPLLVTSTARAPATCGSSSLPTARSSGSSKIPNGRRKRPRRNEASGRDAALRCCGSADAGAGATAVEALTAVMGAVGDAVDGACRDWAGIVPDRDLGGDRLGTATARPYESRPDLIRCPSSRPDRAEVEGQNQHCNESRPDLPGRVGLAGHRLLQEPSTTECVERSARDATER